MELTLDWDQQERRRARNRINQRNYRKRKSEQTKGNDKKQGKSASRSPATPSVREIVRGESELSSQSEPIGDAFNYDTLPSSWQIPSTNLPATSSSIMLPSGISRGESTSLGAWDMTEAAQPKSPTRNAKPQEEAETWHMAKGFEAKQGLPTASSQTHGSAWSGSPDIVALTSRPKPLTSNSSSGKTTLHLAAINGHSQSVRVLLFHGADPNLRDFNGYTALHTAAESGHTKIVAILIAAGSDLNAMTFSGRTALHLAAQHNHSEVIDQLLSAGANPDIQISNQ